MYHEFFTRWAQVTRAHGNVGVVRTKFRKNLPPKSLVRRAHLPLLACLQVPGESRSCVWTLALASVSALPPADCMCLVEGCSMLGARVTT